MLARLAGGLFFQFQPTLPLRGATINNIELDDNEPLISTHAPPEGSDIRMYASWMGLYTFQPTLPLRGATSCLPASFRLLLIFQPTLPLRGATLVFRAFALLLDISTHAPPEGSDSCRILGFRERSYFNPRSP